ncbi:MAG: hypothetical protein ACI92E_003319, partial [Oceanicoccus sp.]
SRTPPTPSKYPPIDLSPFRHGFTKTEIGGVFGVAMVKGVCKRR